MQDPQNDPTPPLTYGLEGKEIPSPSGRGRKMSLTSPLIDQALAQACAVCSPKSGSMSEIGIFQHLPSAFEVDGSVPDLDHEQGQTLRAYIPQQIRFLFRY